MITMKEAVQTFLTGDFCVYCQYLNNCSKQCEDLVAELVDELVCDEVIHQKLIIMDATGNSCQDFTMDALCNAAGKIISRQRQQGVSTLELEYFENFAQKKLKPDVRMRDVYAYILSCSDRTFAIELVTV